MLERCSGPFPRNGNGAEAMPGSWVEAHHRRVCGEGGVAIDLLIRIIVKTVVHGYRSLHSFCLRCSTLSTRRCTIH